MGVTRRRIGVLGGTFDPPHVGHLALARAARDALALDEVRLIPCGQPWQKAGAMVSPAVTRLAMTQCAVAALDRAEGLTVDDREVRRAGPSYMLDTLQSLRAELGPDPALVLILGSDQLRNLPSWHRWTELLTWAHLASTQRERVSLADLPHPVEAMLREHGQASLPDQPAGSVVLFSMPAVPVSASALRAQVARGERADGLSPAEVLDYIQTHRLYQPGPRTVHGS